MQLTGILAMWQTTDPLTVHDIHWLMIWAGVMACSMLFGALIVAIAGLMGLKIQKDVMADVAEVKSKALPMIDKVNALATQVTLTTNELTPTLKNIAAKADIIAGHAEHLSALAREKAEEFAPTITAANETIAQANETVQDANRKTQEQIARVNGMVSSVLDATAQVGNSIKRGIQLPGRELGGLASGIKAAFATLAHRSKPPSRYPAPIEFHQPYRALNPSYRNMSDAPPDVLDEGIPGEPLEQ